MSDLFVLLYLLVTILSLSAYVPQIIALLHATSPQDNFALSSWLTWIGSACISLGYGIFNLKDIMFCIGTGTGLALMIIVVALILYNRHYRFRNAVVMLHA